MQLSVLSGSGPGQQLVRVYLSGPLANVDCQKPSGVYFTLSPSQPNYRDMFAILLAARAADLPVSVGIEQGSSDCRVNHVALE